MPERISWIPSPLELDIADGDIHLWRAYLDCEEQLLRRFEETLSDDEKDRAKRYFFQRDRDNFIATRGILRELLGKYIGSTPTEIEFRYSPYGKPSLMAKGFGQPIQFNLSHSHGLALFAFAVGRNLGVDVELVRSDFGGEEIAMRYFAPQEVEELRKLPASLQAEAFFLCWTRKEAYVKARGEGLQIALNSFHVSLTPGQPELLYSDDSFRWSLRSLRPDQRYVGALVGEVGDWRPRYWDWKPSKRM
ncbi:MAG: 4'-phosphopantetheinyl transferase superfamily protein [Candidatus Acidiferrum sp.]